VPDVQVGTSFNGDINKNEKRPLRIAQVLSPNIGSSWGEITPETLNKGLGGRETAVINLSKEWALQGHEVYNFVPIERTQHYWYGKYTVHYVNQAATKAVLSTVPFDVIISWEEPAVFSWPEVVESVPVKLIGMQVAHLWIPENIEPNVDGYVCLSDWARRFLNDFSDSGIPLDKIHIIPNGVNLERYRTFPYQDPDLRRLGKEFFYSSSPDRGLHHLLRIWPRVRNEIRKDAILRVGYGATRWTKEFKWSHHMHGEAALQVDVGLRQRGVIDIGLVGQFDLAKIQSKAIMLPYTCDTMSPTETGCITVVEAMAAHCPVVTTDCDCLGEEYGEAAKIVPLPFDDDKFLEAMSEVLNDKDIYEELTLKGYKVAEERTWQRTSMQWMELIHSKIGERSHATAG
jgi:glycosyltransferase involved in cell wall biosynthesis